MAAMPSRDRTVTETTIGLHALFWSHSVGCEIRIETQSLFRSVPAHTHNGRLPQPTYSGVESHNEVLAGPRAGAEKAGHRLGSVLNPWPWPWRDWGVAEKPAPMRTGA
jgi:hypothetical protein